MMRSLSALALSIGLASFAAAAQAQTTPAPNAPLKPMAYYIMQGTIIISPAYSDPSACQKALLKIQRDTAPGKDMMACAHRRP